MKRSKILWGVALCFLVSSPVLAMRQSAGRKATVRSSLSNHGGMTVQAAKTKQGITELTARQGKKVLGVADIIKGRRGGHMMVPRFTTTPMSQQVLLALSNKAKSIVPAVTVPAPVD